jgi:hypothetical protein
MNTVHNARVQLLANLLNAMAGSSFTVGVAAPVAASVFYSASSLRVVAVAIGVGFWLVVATVLHLAAQRVLGGLRNDQP